jgi:hypothetical protein
MEVKRAIRPTRTNLSLGEAKMFFMGLVVLQQVGRVNEKIQRL